MEELTIENNMQQNLGNKLGEWQHTFLESTLGKTINAGVDIGLKAVLPDLIEDEVIDVKNTILEQGFSEGIKEIVQTGINMGKSMLGIVTGNFENISQIQMAVKNGGILDKVSELLDFSIHLAKNKNLINNQIASLLKQGKNSIIHSVSDKIEETLTNQLKSVEKLEKYCSNWNVAYASQDFSKMETAYKNIEQYLSKTIPLENIINKARTIENLHHLIKNNGQNFHLTEEEMKLAETLG